MIYNLRIVLVFVIMLNFSTLILGNNESAKIKLIEKAPMVTEPIYYSNNKSPNNVGKTVHYTESNVTAVLAAKMWNAYSPQSSTTNLIAFDPFSNSITITHRGDVSNNAGSGYLWYAVSNDAGANWVDIGNFNFNNVITARHPGVGISNPTQNTDPFSADIKPIMFWNTLDPSDWARVQSATDAQLYAGSAAFSTDLCVDTCFSNISDVDQNNGNMWISIADLDAAAADVGGRLLWTQDQGENWLVQEVISFQELHGSSATPVSNVNHYQPFFSPDGATQYFFLEAQVPPDIDPAQEYQFYFKSSTDYGSNWSDITYLPTAAVAGLDSATGLNYEVDFIVDSDGNPHFVGTYIYNTQALIQEVYWNADSSRWDSKVITDVFQTVWTLPGPSALQSLNEPEFARSLDGKYIFVKWIDNPDSLSLIADVFISGRYIGSDNEWSEPINVTNSPDIFEKFTNLATHVTEISRTDSNITVGLHAYYTIFGDGDTDDLTESELWYLKDLMITVPGPTTGIGDIPDTVPAEFALEQNYPNPFNPSTTISFTLQKSANVKLNVYSINGEKVATLANGSRTAGTHDIVFDASNLSSGVYFYTLSSGEFSQTKKMVLMK